MQDLREEVRGIKRTHDELVVLVKKVWKVMEEKGVDMGNCVHTVSIFLYLIDTIRI